MWSFRKDLEKKKKVAKSSADYPVSCLLAEIQKRVELPLLPAGVKSADVHMWSSQMCPCFCLIHIKKRFQPPFSAYRSAKTVAG